MAAAAAAVRRVSYGLPNAAQLGCRPGRGGAGRGRRAMGTPRTPRAPGPTAGRPPHTAGESSAAASQCSTADVSGGSGPTIFRARSFIRSDSMAYRPIGGFSTDSMSTTTTRPRPGAGCDISLAVTRRPGASGLPTRESAGAGGERVQRPGTQ